MLIFPYSSFHLNFRTSDSNYFTAKSADETYFENSLVESLSSECHLIFLQSSGKCRNRFPSSSVFTYIFAKIDDFTVVHKKQQFAKKNLTQE